MAIYFPGILSGSSNGRVIPVAATTTPGTLIHTAVAGTTGMDEVYMRASNITSASVTLTVEWGGVTDPGDHLVHEYSLPPNCLPIQIALGERMQGGVSVRAFGSIASAINITGYVNLIR